MNTETQDLFVLGLNFLLPSGYLFIGEIHTAAGPLPAQAGEPFHSRPA
jgi:hypothetical protein